MTRVRLAEDLRAELRDRGLAWISRDDPHRTRATRLRILKSVVGRAGATAIPEVPVQNLELLERHMDEADIR